MHHNGMPQLRCFLCSQQIAAGASLVTTNDGVLVHRACADREAGRRYARRSVQVAVAGALFSDLILLAVLEGVRGVPLATLIATLISLHLTLHRHWWRLTLPVRWQRPFWRLGRRLRWWS